MLNVLSLQRLAAAGLFDCPSSIVSCRSDVSCPSVTSGITIT